MKILIPTKLDKAAAATLSTAGYDVVQNDSTPIEELVAANPDAAGIIVRSEKVTPAIIDALPSRGSSVLSVPEQASTTSTMFMPAPKTSM